MKTQNKKGFTIVELVIVIAVIAILAAVLIPTFINLTKKANESADIQACRNMNTFLTTAKVTGDIKSPMDIYGVFESSGYAVESYTPLSADHHYYYDDQYNQVLYVDTKTDTVVYPSEHQGKPKQSGHNWYSLSMTVVSMEQPNVYEDKDDTITATVSNAKEYAFVIAEYNKKAKENTSLNLTLDNDIDLQGTYCIIEETKGNVTINGGGHTIKNGASNQTLLISNGNAEKQNANYAASAFIGTVSKNNTVTIKNVIFDNMNVKTITGGTVAIIASYVYGTLEVKDVTIQNSTVIGHRDVSAVAAQVTSLGTLSIQGKLTLRNVNILTIGGRSALICRLGYKSSRLEIPSAEAIVIDGSSVGIYNNPESMQEKIATDSPQMKDACIIKGQECFIKSIKMFANGDKGDTFSTYGYSSKAVVTVGHGYSTKELREEWKFYNTVEDVMSELVKK